MGLLDFLRRRGSPTRESVPASPVARTQDEELAHERERERLDPSAARIDAEPTGGGEPERDRPPRSQ